MNAELIGVVGTLLGTLLGWFLNSFSKRGKLFIYPVMNDKFEYNHGGIMETCKNQKEATLYRYNITLDLHNSSGEPKIMRKIELSFNNGKQELFRITPDDDKTERSFGSMVFYDKILPLNIPAKSVVTVKLHGGLWESDDSYPKIWNANEVYLVYKNDEDKEVKTMIKKDDFSHYFANHSNESEKD